MDRKIVILTPAGEANRGSFADVAALLKTLRCEVEFAKLGDYELKADDATNRNFAVLVDDQEIENRVKIKTADEDVQIEAIPEVHVEMADSIVKFRDLSINTSNFVVMVEGVSVYLSLKEFDILLYLVKNANRVVTRDELTKNVWHWEEAYCTRTVDVHMRRLRSKLGPKYAGFIKSARSLGYMWVTKKSWEVSDDE